MIRGSLHNHPQFYYMTREKTRHSATVTEKGHRLLPRRVRRDSLLLSKCYWRSLLGPGWKPQTQREICSHVHLPRVLGTVNLILDGLTVIPRGGERGP